MIGYYGEPSKYQKLQKPYPVPLFVYFDTIYVRNLVEESGGRFMMLEFDPQHALMLDSPAEFEDKWVDSGAAEYSIWEGEDPPPKGWFHPRTTNFFSMWAEEKEYDAVIMPASIYDGEGGDWVANIIPEPQVIILDPDIIREITVLEL